SPEATAATVENIARALIGKRRIQTKVVGVRPGEKMHEIMVSEEEAHHCVRRGKYLAILPMLPELSAGAKEPRPALTREFSSADKVLDYAGTVRLLKRNRLMVEHLKSANLQEVLR